MKVIAVDDEELILHDIVSQLRGIERISEAVGFSDALAAIAYLRENEVDVTFLDINMRPMDGLALAKQIKKISPKTYIIFLTGYSKYAVDAFKLKVGGYLMKPVSSEDIETELDFIKNCEPQQSTARIRVQTFGNFEVFADDVPVAFRRSKSKELLAYLIDRKGASVTLSETAAILFEDREYDRSLQNQMQTIVSDMMKSLKNAKSEHIIIKSRNSMAVDTLAFECDYYAFMRGDIGAVNLFMNEYMTNYSWAEFTVGSLIERSKS